MKNIHILPTDKPSRLHKIGNELGLTNTPNSNFLAKQHNIYITSDEGIKDDDWVYCPVLKKPVFICLDSILMFKDLGYDSNGNSKYKKEWLKKIILTTDPDLIKYGVQAIDDEFLEWFVKNPSCESVEIDKNWNYPLDKSWEYKIIIPKEEPKQETLEEDLLNTAIQVVGDNNITTIKEFLVKHKWQAERMYSEEDLKEVYFSAIKSTGEGRNGEYASGNSPVDIKKEFNEEFEKWFEQFKKK